MRRYLSVWLPHWSIQRRKLQKAKHNQSNLNIYQNTPLPTGQPNEHPFALTTNEAHGVHICAANKTALAAGVTLSLPLTDARALCPNLITEEATPEDDLVDLKKLALWCLSFSPLITDHPPDGLALDITGCDHLFGGEQAMALHIQTRLKQFGLISRLAVADTIGAAWAIARYSDLSMCCIRPNQNTKSLSPLPLASLRIENKTVIRLRQLGFRKIGDLIGIPTAPFMKRFGPDLIRRLYQALGQEKEVFNPLFPAPIYSLRYAFMEPALYISTLEVALRPLANEMQEILFEAQKGARQLTLCLYRVDGQVMRRQIQTSRLCRKSDQICLLFQENFTTLHDDFDAGFGIELMTLQADEVELVAGEQETLSEPTSQIAKDASINPADNPQIDQLIDRFGNRFGFEKVTRFIPKASHIPEKTFQESPVTTQLPKKRLPWHDLPISPGLRPLLLFTPPEPITVLAEVPDGPPLRFKWRKLQHHIASAEGPERLAPEWWDVSDPQASKQTRDYYRVEDQGGHRFWLFRDGLYERENDTPRWFMHGLFP
jgi:protein ImuB